MTFNKYMTTPIMLFLAILYVGIFPHKSIAAKKCELILSESEVKERSDLLKKLLKNREFATLDDLLNTRQAKVEREMETDEFLRLEFNGSFSNNPEIEPFLTEWVKKFPQSYSAHVARAFHYVASGYTKRGDKFASKTSDEQFEAMEKQFKKATIDLDKAISLSKKPTLAYVEKILIARASHKNGSVGEIVNKANVKFPRSLAIKAMTVFTLNPKWGGSLKGFASLLEIARAAQMNAKEMEYLEYLIEMEKADYYEIIVEQKTTAASYYKNAGEICETFTPWEKVASTSYTISDWDSVIVASNHLVNIDPSRGYVYQRRGWAYEKTSQMAKAVKDYEIAADLGSDWAQNKLGWLLWQGIYLSKDLNRAKKLFIKAAGQGNRNAIANLKALNALLPVQDN